MLTAPSPGGSRTCLQAGRGGKGPRGQRAESGGRTSSPRKTQSAPRTSLGAPPRCSHAERGLVFLPLSFTGPGPHTHTTTPHTMLQESVPQRPLILSLKHKGLAAHYPSASCLAWPQEGGGPWPVLQPLRSQRVGTHVGKDFPSKQPGRGLFRGSGLPPSVTDAPAPTQSTQGEASTGSGETGPPLPWGGEAAATLAPRHWVSVFSGGHSLAHGPEAAASELTRVLPHSIRTPAPLPPSPARGQ